MTKDSPNVEHIDAGSDVEVAEPGKSKLHTLTDSLETEPGCSTPNAVPESLVAKCRH